jgi:hypothetical protein
MMDGLNRLSNNFRNFDKALPIDGGGLPASRGAEGDQGFGWG